mmetsp:Transcript_62776/g.99535  ORF Transcript_62776/g.99535 Transcript_62776/m.99535 type:complete len:229 (-) Transcript_62776:547-1233(-)
MSCLNVCTRRISPIQGREIFDGLCVRLLFGYIQRCVIISCQQQRVCVTFDHLFENICVSSKCSLVNGTECSRLWPYILASRIRFDQLKHFVPLLPLGCFDDLMSFLDLAWVSSRPSANNIQFPSLPTCHYGKCLVGSAFQKVSSFCVTLVSCNLLWRLSVLCQQFGIASVLVDILSENVDLSLISSLMDCCKLAIGRAHVHISRMLVKNIPCLVPIELFRCSYQRLQL